MAVAEHAEGPTVGKLQKEQENLTKQLVHANKRVMELEQLLDKLPLSIIIYKKIGDFLYNLTKNFKE